MRRDDYNLLMHLFNKLDLVTDEDEYACWGCGENGSSISTTCSNCSNTIVSYLYRYDK